MTFGASTRAAFGGGAGGTCCASAPGAKAAAPAAVPIVASAARRETDALLSRANVSSFMIWPSQGECGCVAKHYPRIALRSSGEQRLPGQRLWKMVSGRLIDRGGRRAARDKIGGGGFVMMRIAQLCCLG